MIEYVPIIATAIIAGLIGGGVVWLSWSIAENIITLRKPEPAEESPDEAPKEASKGAKP